MTTMKRCPFCGHAGAKTVGDGEHWYVACGNAECFCSLGEIWDRDAMPEHHFKSEAEAIAGWNKRPHAKKPTKGKCNCSTVKGQTWTCPVHGNVAR